ncbi:MAG: leucine-rich repeat protein [Oscillospiraceae bacterium]|nr:leucine-rich repeat protein [Oscillospiraceae bacterium]
MKSKRILSTVIVIAMMVALLPAMPNSAHAAGDADGDGWSFVAATGTLTVMTNEGTTNWHSGEVSDDDVQTLIIGEDVTSIGDGAFAYTAITTVTIPESVTYIGHRAFMQATNLTSVTIGKGVTAIESGAFQLSPISAFEVNPENTAFSEYDGVLFNKGQTTLVIYPNGKSDTSYEIPNGVERIDNFAFAHTFNITSIKIPDSVTTIGYSAFEVCNKLTAFEVDPENTAFSSESGVLFNKEKTTLIRYPSNKADTLYEIPDSVETIAFRAFAENWTTESITIPDSVKVIEAEAFFYTGNLYSITIPDSVTEIGNGAFVGCWDLTLVTIGSGVTAIGDSAFVLEYWEVGDTDGHERAVIFGGEAPPTTLGSNVFDNRAKPTLYVRIDSKEAYQSVSQFVGYTIIEWPLKVEFDSQGGSEVSAFEAIYPMDRITAPSAPTYAGHTFGGWYKDSACTTIWDFSTDTVKENTTLYAKWSSDESGDGSGDADGDGWSFVASTGTLTVTTDAGTTNWHSGEVNPAEVQTLIIGEDVTEIGYNAFAFTAITTVTIPDSVVYIGYGAFWRAENLTSVTIGKGVTSIGCDSFLYVPISAFEVNSENTAFSEHDGVLFNKEKTTLICYPSGKADTSYEIPDSVEIIGYRAFSGYNITSITIPDSVTGIADTETEYEGWFRYLANLTDIYVGSDNTAFSSENGVLFNKEKTTLIRYPGNKSGTSGTSYEIPDGVETIDFGAFIYNRNITSITIPDGVLKIGTEAFRSTDLRSITIPDSVTDIGDGAFAGCQNLTLVTIGSGVTEIGNEAFVLPYWEVGDTDGHERAVVFVGEAPPSVLGDNVFDNQAKPTLYVPIDSKGAYQSVSQLAGYTIMEWPLKMEFDSQGGSEILAFEGIFPMSKITAPSAPTYAGHTFGGWYKDPDCTTIWDFSTDMVKENTTLYAKFREDKAPEKISAIVLDIEAKSVGSEMDIVFSENDETVVVITWNHATGEEGAVFAAGDIPLASVSVTAKEGYEFDDDIVITVPGASAVTKNEHTSTWISFDATWDELESELSPPTTITGVDFGYRPSLGVLVPSEFVYLDDVIYYDVAMTWSGLSDNEMFTFGDIPVATITLTAKEGVIFSDDIAITFPDATVVITEVDSYGKYVKLTATWDKLVKLRDISIPGWTIRPHIGDTPLSDLSATYYEGSIIWSGLSNDEIFTVGDIPVATITLTAKDEVVFVGKDDIDLRIADATVVITEVAADGKYVVFTVTFTELKSSSPPPPPAPPPSPEPIADQSPETFLADLYQNILGRDADEDGYDDTIAALLDGSVTATEIVYDFVFSPEMEAKDLSDDDFVETLYLAFFGREPDPDGKAHWLNALATGTTREQIFLGFSNSTEFVLFCLDHGIAARGYNDWIAARVDDSTTATKAMSDFMFSPGMTARNFDDEDFVETLYKVFFGRASDPSGKAHWVNALASGMTREQVLLGFAGSSEYDLLCEAYGFVR